MLTTVINVARSLKYLIGVSPCSWTAVKRIPASHHSGSFRVFFVVLEELSTRNNEFLPSTFELTDRSVVSLMSCALGLSPDEVGDSTYVKGLRQRLRNRARGLSNPTQGESRRGL